MDVPAAFQRAAAGTRAAREGGFFRGFLEGLRER